MYKKIFIMSLATGIFASVAGIIFNKVYFFAFEISFGKLVNYGTLVGLNIAVCLLAGFGYWAAKKYVPQKADIIFNITFTFVSFLSIYFPMTISLPLLNTRTGKSVKIIPLSLPVKILPEFSVD